MLEEEARGVLVCLLIYGPRLDVERVGLFIQKTEFLELM